MTYKLHFDRFRFLVFDISPDELSEKFGEEHFFMLDEATWAGFWKPLNARFHDYSDKKNLTTLLDITCWFAEQLVLSEKTHQKCL